MLNEENKDEMSVNADVDVSVDDSPDVEIGRPSVKNAPLNKLSPADVDDIFVFMPDDFKMPEIADGIHEYPKEDESGKTTVTFKDGKKNGLSQVFENKRLLIEMNFLNDCLNGFFKYYYPNKALQMLINYCQDKLEGEFLQYHPNGIVSLQAFYKNGLQEGISKNFDEKGNLSQESFFKDGLLEGPRNTYYEGELIARTFFKEGVELSPENNF